MTKKLERHAEQLGALGHPVRLQVLRFVVQAGEGGAAAGDIQAHVDHDEIGPLAAAQGFHAPLDAVDLAHLRAARDGDFGCGGDLSRKCADDQQAHGVYFRLRNGRP